MASVAAFDAEFRAHFGYNQPSTPLAAMGMIAAIYALAFISSLAAEVFVTKHVFILATVLAVGSYAAFILLLKLQIQVWPTFITG